MCVYVPWLCNVILLQWFMIASINRGQPLAWQTKVVHHQSGCLKADLTGLKGANRCYDTMPSKPVKGRGIVEGQQFSSSVTRCGSKCCKTCFHILEGDSFTSNITIVKYNVVSPNSDMD